MIDIANVKIGDKVHYIAFQGASPENGIVKEVPEGNVSCVRVVFHCAGEWKRYMDYTSQLTPVQKLHKGWTHQPSLKLEY